MENVFLSFRKWLHDGKDCSEVPEEFLSSPITHTYALSLFLLSRKLTIYLNEVFNNSNLWGIPKEDLFRFLKKCVQEFKLAPRDLKYFKRAEISNFYNILEKIPFLKMGDLDILLSSFKGEGKSEDEILQIFGIKEEIKKEKIKRSFMKKYPLSRLMKHFVYIEV